MLILKKEKWEKEVMDALIKAKDRDIISNKGYRPVVVLVSDGQPTDEWQNPLNDFVSSQN